MSLLYIKSEQYLEDNNGNIISEGSQLPYHFTNTFKEPLNLDEDSTIEVISADLNISPTHEIGENNKNNSFTFCNGNNDDGFFQKVAKLQNGRFDNNSLCENIENECKKITNQDNGDVGLKFDSKTGRFELSMVDFFTDNNAESEFKESNTYQLLNTKMGFQESNSNLTTGTGAYNSDYTIVNKNSLSNENTLFKSNVVNQLTKANLTNNTKAPFLISNQAVPITNGINNATGNACLIASPLQTCKFTPSTFLSNVTTETFTLQLNTSSVFTNGTLSAYSGSNSYDMRVVSGEILKYLKFITTQAQLDGFTMENSINTKNLPYGHFLLMNDTDKAIDTSFANIDNVLYLDTDTSTRSWNMFSSSVGGRTGVKFFCTNNNDYIKSQETKENIGSWGSCGLGLSRGETALLNSQTGLTNQVDATNRFTRTRVFNTTAASSNQNDIYADYSLQLSTNNSGNTFALMNYGVQVAGKVAGDADWLDLITQGRTSAVQLDNLFSTTLTKDDNIMLIANMTEYLCVKFSVAKDTAGNLVFDDVVELGNTEADQVGEHAIHLPMNFNEGSYPIMPVASLQTSYIGDAGHEQLLFGNYSQKLAKDFNLQKLNKYMMDNWSQAQTIPVRQTKQVLTNYCAKFFSTDFTIKINPDGFNGKTTDGSITIPDGVIDGFIHGDSSCLFRIGGPLVDGRDNSDLQTLSDYGYNVEPNKLSSLYLNLGFNKILVGDNEGAKVFNSTQQPLYSGGENFVINFNNLGRITGQNSSTGSISQMVAVVPDGELVQNNLSSNDKHFKAPYPLPVDVNAVGKQKINNFQVFITDDKGKPATSLNHPTNIFCKIGNKK